jgi:hypothetical protein
VPARRMRAACVRVPLRTLVANNQALIWATDVDAAVRILNGEHADIYDPAAGAEPTIGGFHMLAPAEQRWFATLVMDPAHRADRLLGRSPNGFVNAYPTHPAAGVVQNMDEGPPVMLVPAALRGITQEAAAAAIATAAAPSDSDGDGDDVGARDVRVAGGTNQPGTNQPESESSGDAIARAAASAASAAAASAAAAAGAGAAGRQLRPCKRPFHGPD